MAITTSEAIANPGTITSVDFGETLGLTDQMWHLQTIPTQPLL